MHTRLPRLWPAWPALITLTALSLQAQPAARTSDQEWADLVQLTRGRSGIVTNASEAASIKAVQQEQLNAVATAAGKFVRDYPSHSQAAEASRWQAKSRLTMALLAARPLSGAVQALATSVRRDARLPVAERYEVAFLAEMAGEGGRSDKSRTTWLAVREQSARTLIAEFPGQPGGYGLLLQVARRATGASAGTLARELVASDAPEDIRAAAQDLLDRQAFVGQALTNVTAGVLGAAPVIEPAAGKPLIIYTWSPSHPGSISLAKQLLRLAPPEAVIIAINLDRDANGAQTEAGRLPGVQLYEGRGFDSPFVRQLRLTSVPLVYLVDRQGIIRSTDAHKDLAAQLADMEGIQ